MLHRLAFLIIVLIGGVPFSAWARRLAELPRLEVPPGYAYPERPRAEIPAPFADPSGLWEADCHVDWDIQLHYQDYAAWELDMDRYAGKHVTWDLLTFEHGYQKAWLGPQFGMRLYQPQRDKVWIASRHHAEAFEKVEDDGGRVELVCVSDDEWWIRRDGERIVVENLHRWWAFETPDGGANWRLVQTGRHNTPYVVTLHYEGRLPLLASALEYPDGARVEIEPANDIDAPGRIALPNGFVYEIEYDAAGYPVLLEEYRTATEVDRDLTHFRVWREDGVMREDIRHREVRNDRLELIRRWTWENDAEGRITRMVSPCGRETQLTYARRETDTGIEHVVVQTDALTGDYRAQRHTMKGAGESFAYKGKVWTFQRLRGV